MRWGRAIGRVWLTLVVTLGVTATVAVTAAAAARPNWTLARAGDYVSLQKSTPGTESYLVVRRGSPAGSFLLASRRGPLRVYQFWGAHRPQHTLIERGGIVAAFDANGRLIAASSFAPTQPTETKRRDARLALVGMLRAVRKGMQDCLRMQKVSSVRPVATACADFWKRKARTLVAKLAGARLAASMVRCSRTLPANTPRIITSIAAIVCRRA